MGLGDLLRWAFDSDDDVSAGDMRDALVKGGIVEPVDEPPRAMFHDPYSVSDWGGWRHRPSSLTYDTLRIMARRCAPIAAILQLRQNQIAQFARPQQGDYDRGYRVVLRDRRDQATMTSAQKKKAAEIERFLETTGALNPNEKPHDRDSFRTFLKKAVRDTLTYDQWCFEKIPNRKGLPSRFIALPSHTIMPAMVDVEHQDVEDRRERVAYVQVWDNSVIAEWTVDELAWCVMNPDSDIRANGFGTSPTELIVQLVTAWLFGFEYNQRFFSQGSAIKGVLNIKGTIPDKQMRAFRRMWYTMVSGVSNAWRTPILNSDDLQWVSMHSTNREMEFSGWMDWLTKLICAVYGVDPTEINFQFGNTGQSSSLNEGNVEAKLTESKDKGLRPLIDHLIDNLNAHVIWEIEPDFELSFAGLDPDGEEQAREARLKDVAAIKTVDEVRAEINLPKLPDGKGEVVLSPVWVQWAMAKDAPPGGEPGFGGDGGGFGEGGFGGDEGEDDDPKQLPPGDDSGDDDDEAGDPVEKALRQLGLTTDALYK